MDQEVETQQLSSEEEQKQLEKRTELMQVALLNKHREVQKQIFVCLFKRNIKLVFHSRDKVAKMVNELHDFHKQLSLILTHQLIMSFFEIMNSYQIFEAVYASAKILSTAQFSPKLSASEAFERVSKLSGHYQQLKSELETPQKYPLYLECENLISMLLRACELRKVIPNVFGRRYCVRFWKNLPVTKLSDK